MSTNISREDWLAALEEAHAADHHEDTDALTCAEYGELVGVHPVTARRQLKRLVALKKAVIVQKWIKRSDGSHIRIPAFRLIKGGKK